MARPPKGKPLTLRPIRLDDDVWAECQRLGKEHGTINEGLRVALGWNDPAISVEPAKEILDQMRQSVDAMMAGCPECGRIKGHSIGCVTHNEAAMRRQQPERASGRGKVSTETWKRGPRPKGDKTR